MQRDYIAEALAIVEGRSILLAQDKHLTALYGLLQGHMRPEDWAAMHVAHSYPPVEPDAEFERRTRG